MKTRRVLSSVLFWLGFVLPAGAQNASLTGIVKDPQGAIVPGAATGDEIHLLSKTGHPSIKSMVVELTRISHNP